MTENGALWCALPPAWTLGQVKNAASVTLGKMLQTMNSGADVSAPYLRAANVQPDGVLRLGNLKSMWFSTKELQSLDLRAGDVVVVEGGVGGYGRAALVSKNLEGVGFQNSINRLRPHCDHDGRFIAYYLIALRESGFIQAHANVSSMPHLTAEKLAAIPLPIPPHDEQRRIAEFLDAESAQIDTLIAEQERLIELLRERRLAVIELALTSLPWNVPLRAVTSLIQTGPFGSQLKSDEYEPGGTAVINPSHLINGRITADANVAVSEGTAQKLARHALREGDIVAARRGELGRCAVVSEVEAGFLCGTGSALIRPLRARLEPRFLALVFGSRQVRDTLSLNSVGATMDNLNADIISALRIPLPSTSEQTRILERIDEQTARIDGLIAEARRIIALSKERRAALITAAVTGQIDASTGRTA